SKDAQIVQALDARYSFYREKFQEVANREIQEELSEIDFSPAEIDNDEFHDNEEGFAEYMYSNKLSAKLLKKIASLPGLKENAKRQLKETTYRQWLKKHETAEEKKFTKELEEKILSQELPPDFAQTHYEADQFQQKWFELIKGGLSDDLKNEHAEELKKLLGKDRVQKAFAQKFEAYEEAHDKAMEQKFSAELISLNASVSIPTELIQKSLTPDEFKKEWFALLLKNASPELLEELEEHADLREKLFKHQQLQVGMESNYKKYKLEHDTVRESKFSQELVSGIEAFKFPAEMMKNPLSEAQFLQEMAQHLFKSASPELQKDKELQASLLANPKIKAQLAKKYAEYQKSLKKPEKAEKEIPEKEQQKKEEMMEENMKAESEKPDQEAAEEKKKTSVKQK